MAGHEQMQCTFRNWTIQKQEDLEGLVAALTTADDEKMKLLSDRTIKHFEEYGERRAMMGQRYAPSLLCPSWCTTFENAFMWIGGCRPSLSIRLVYSVCGSELDAQLSELLGGGERRGNLAEISAKRLDMINALHCKTIKEEEKMCCRMASLQEEIADKPLAIIANSAGRVGEANQEVQPVMDAHCISLATILADADKLRLSTIKELIGILTPQQALDLLVATKKLHLSVHEWGKRRDHHFEILITPSSSQT